MRLNRNFQVPLRGTCLKRNDCNFYLDEGCKNPAHYDCYQPSIELLILRLERLINNNKATQKTS